MFTFQSTLPVRGATAPGNCTRRNPNISIHAPRAGSDPPRRSAETANSYFNPRSPCGERPFCGLRCTAQVHFNPRSPCGERRLPGVISQPFCLFQSTLPVRGATDMPDDAVQEMAISIHAPRAGSDHQHAYSAPASEHFNPRSPCGERQQYIVLLQAQSAIYTQSAILSIVNAIKGRRLLIEFGAKACGISCVLQIRTHKTSGSSTGIVSFEP